MTINLEDRIRAALNAAAENVDPTEAEPGDAWSAGTGTPASTPAGIRPAGHVPADHVPNRSPHPSRPASRPSRPHRRPRWVAPVAAVIGVLAVIATALIVSNSHLTQRDIDRAATLVYSADRADIGGVAFPIPDGWAVRVVESNSRQVRACVAESPASACDGVSIVIALPDGPPLDIRPLGNCADSDADYLIHADDGDTLGGRAAAHYYQWCGQSGPVRHQWMLLDFGLEILTPAGKYEQQGRQIADGLDLSGWPRSPGEHQVHSTMGTASRADGNTAADAVTENGRISLYGASFPIPDGWETLDISDSDAVQTICLARTPTTDCGGVTIRMAAPGAPALAPASPVGDCTESPRIPALDKGFTIMGGRLARHIIGTCGSKNDPAEHLWELADRSLQITTPRGRYAEQGAFVAAGLNLLHWQRPESTITAGATSVAHSSAATRPSR